MGILTRIWDLGRRELLAELESNGHVAFDNDGRYLAFGAPEGGIGVWDRDERRVVRRLPLDFTPGHLAFDPEDRRLAVTKQDRAAPRVVILEAETGRVLADWRRQVGNQSPTWSADGQLLAVGGVGGEDPRVYVWNVRRNELQSVLEGHADMVLHVKFAHSGFLVATVSQCGTARLWDGASGEPLAVALEKYFSDFAPDDRRLTFTTNGGIGVCDVSTAPERRTLHAGMTGNRAERWLDRGVRAAQFSPDEKLLATAAEDGVRLWDVDPGRELAHLKAGGCCSALFDPDGQGIITSGRRGVYRWPIRPDSAQAPGALAIGPPELLWESISGDEWAYASWLPDRRTLAIVENARAQVMLVDSRGPHPAQSRAIVVDSGQNHRTNSLAVSPDGHWLAAGGHYEAGVTVWDLRRRRLERILRPREATSWTKFFVGFSPDGRWLVSSTMPDASSGAYHFWRVGTWELGQRIEDKHIAEQTAFTTDGRLMALRIDNKVSLADAATGRELAGLSTVQPVAQTPLSFSPDGTKLVVTTDRNTALVWDLRQIRAQLAPMGLDWDASPYPTAPVASGPEGPLPPRPVRVVGEVLEIGARREAELAEMNRRLTADPNDAEALIDRGWLRINLSKPAEAVIDLERAVRLLPDDSDTLFLLSQAYVQANKLRAALAALETYLARCADDTDARLKKGVLAFRLGRFAEAAAEFSRVLEADSGRDAVRARRAETLLRLRRFSEALADLDTLIERYPNDPTIFESRSRAHDALGHGERARADRKRAAELPKADADFYNERAWRLATGPIALRDPEQALASARKAVALTPKSALYLNTLGVAQFRAGLYGDAIDTLRKSLAASQGETDGFDLYFLAMARSKFGDALGARADFDRAVRWQREHPNPSQPRWSAQLNEFRAEAEAALTGPGPDWPDDVFAPLQDGSPRYGAVSSDR
jgi:WD40 repeat protein/tetratricopeptide (TPR) repeat protein